MLHPTRQDDNPTASFAVGSPRGPCRQRNSTRALPDALVFKGQAVFAQAFEEPLRIRVHHFQDVNPRLAGRSPSETVFSSVLGIVSWARSPW